MHPLRKWRKNKKINQLELSKLIGLSRQSINMIENNKQMPSSNKMLEILILTNITPIEMYLYYKKMSNEQDKNCA